MSVPMRVASDAATRSRPVAGLPPQVSVVIPTRNEHANLPLLLELLTSQAWERIAAIDGGTPAHTRIPR